MTPVSGATAVFNVTAVKLPWEGRDKRRRDENNALSYNLLMSKVSQLGEREGAFVGAGRGCCRSGQKLEIKTMEASHLCIQPSCQKATPMVTISLALFLFFLYLCSVALFLSPPALALIRMNSCCIIVFCPLLLLAPLWKPSCCKQKEKWVGLPESFSAPNTTCTH